MEFLNKVVLITGGGSGIGKATASAFAKEGGIVVVSDIQEENGKAVVQEIIQAGGKATFRKANVAVFEEVENLTNQIVEQYGKLDIAINNAGIGGIPSRTIDHSFENWDKVMAINATGVFYCLKSQIKQMLAQGGGAIVNTASIAGIRGLPNNIAYVASKHAVVGMTKTAAMEYARKNIRINAICPAFTVTPLFNPATMEQLSKGLSDKLKATIPMKRFGNPMEIAMAILWLCSEKASFVTGQALAVDGGLTA